MKKKSKNESINIAVAKNNMINDGSIYSINALEHQSYHLLGKY